MNTPRLNRYSVQVLAALGIVAMLGGCIVVPIDAPGYYRPHRHHYYR